MHGNGKEGHLVSSQLGIQEVHQSHSVKGVAACGGERKNEMSSWYAKLNKYAPFAVCETEI